MHYDYAREMLRRETGAPLLGALKAPKTFCTPGVENLIETEVLTPKAAPAAEVWRAGVAVRLRGFGNVAAELV
jgi:hypothetical protein